MRDALFRQVLSSLLHVGWSLYAYRVSGISEVVIIAVGEWSELSRATTMQLFALYLL